MTRKKGDSERGPIRPLRETLASYGRSVAGALIISLPAIYTMEIWWRGYTPDAARLLLLLISGFVLLFMFEYFTGLHGRGRRGWGNALGEACEGLFIAFLVTWLLLALFDVLPPFSSAREWLGKLLSTSIAVAVGVAIGDSQLVQGRDVAENARENEKHESSSLHQLAFSIMGAVALVAAIIPTEEVTLLANQLSPLARMLVVVLSYGICLTFGAMIGPSSDHPGGLAGLAAVTYLGAFIAVFILLTTGGDLLEDGTQMILGKIAIAGLPASVGAAAGKALIR